MSQSFRQWDSSHRQLYAFLFLILGMMGFLIYLAFHRPLSSDVTLANFDGLQDVYKKEGLDRFLEEKEKLKSRVTEQMSNPRDSDELNHATNIAVYLFPTTLPADDLERQVGEEDWGSLQTQIEKSPGTERSRELFEEMRANIWNYENPSRTLPELTAQAQQVLRIYKTLSTP